MTQLSELAATTTATATTATPEFERATSLAPVPGADGQFAVDLDPGWSSLVGIHGGYLCALAVRAAEAVAGGGSRPVRTITTSFLRTGRPGPATVVAAELRRGRSMSTVTAEVHQDGRLLTTSRLTLVEPRAGVEWQPTAPPPEPPLLPPDECVRIDTGERRVVHFERADGLLDPASLPGAGGSRARVRGYLRPWPTSAPATHRPPVDPAWLAMASDWFPPPAFVRLAPPTGGVSIDLTTHVHQPHVALGADEWLTGEFEIETSTGGLAVEHGRLTGPDGRLVAESFQTRLTAGAA
jgi:acyl-CoA thioesterase